MTHRQPGSSRTRLGPIGAALSTAIVAATATASATAAPASAANATGIDEDFLYTLPALVELTAEAPSEWFPDMPWGEGRQPAAVRRISGLTGATQLVATAEVGGVTGLTVGLGGEVYAGLQSTTETGLVVDLVELERGGSLRSIARIIDTTGGLVSVTGAVVDLAVDPDGRVLFTRPRIIDASNPTGAPLALAGIGAVDPATGAIASVLDLDDAVGTSGLAFDDDADLWFGVVDGSSGGLVIDLAEFDGETTVIRTRAVDTTAGLVALNGQSFDVAVAASGLVHFTTPAVFNDSFQILRAASLDAFDPETGETTVLADFGGGSATGLAIDAGGTLVVGEVTRSSPLRIELRRVFPGGLVEEIGLAFDTTDGLFDLLGQRFDVAADPHAVRRFLAAQACTSDLTNDGRVDGADLNVLLAQWGSAGSGDLDGSGTVDGADLTQFLATWGPCPE